ncbi:hypothetical protein LCGC14_2296710, partial [marine sediment metagenome]
TMKTVNIRKKAILALTLGLIVLFTFSSFTLAAQAKINKLDVAIKPEYDKEKTVFRSYTGELSETLQKMIWYTPTTLLEDSTLHFCAIMEDGAHSCQLREKETVGDLYKITTPMPRKEFLSEGYFESIKDNDGKKTLDYTFKAGHDIDELNLFIAEPKNSKNFKVEPAGQKTGQDGDGLNNAIYAYKNVKKDKEYKFKISYDKKGWDVSLERSGMGAAATSSNTGNSSSTNIFAVLGVVLGFVAIGGGALFYFSNKANAKGARPSPVAPKSKARFCSNCGSRLSSGKFCPNCGAKT